MLCLTEFFFQKVIIIVWIQNWWVSYFVSHETCGIQILWFLGFQCWSLMLKLTIQQTLLAYLTKWTVIHSTIYSVLYCKSLIQNRCIKYMIQFYHQAVLLLDQSLTFCLMFYKQVFITLWWFDLRNHLKKPSKIRANISRICT